MLPNPLTQNDAAKLYNKNKLLMTDEVIQLADWYTNKQLAERANRSVLNRPANQPEREPNDAGGDLNTALNKRADAENQEPAEMKVFFRIRRGKSFKIKFGENSREFKNVWKKKQRTEAEALVERYGVEVMNPVLASSDNSDSDDNSDNRITFDSAIFDDIRKFRYDGLEATSRKYEIEGLWTKLVRENDTALMAEDLTSIFLHVPNVKLAKVDALKDATIGLSKVQYRALRILWLVTIVHWVIQLPDMTSGGEGKDEYSLLNRLLRVTDDYNRLAGSLKLLPITKGAGIDYTIVYGHHILSQLHPDVSYHLHLALFVKEVQRHDQREYEEMHRLTENQDLHGRVLPLSTTSLQSFMTSVTNSAMETWLKSPRIFEDRVPLFENMRVIAGMRFDPPMFDGGTEEDGGDEDDDDEYVE